jgi:hypothetical protein
MTCAETAHIAKGLTVSDRPASAAVIIWILLMDSELYLDLEASFVRPGRPAARHHLCHTVYSVNPLSSRALSFTSREGDLRDHDGPPETRAI